MAFILRSLVIPTGIQMTKIQVIMSLVLCSTLNTVLAAASSPFDKALEAKVVANVDQLMPNAITTLERAVNINSGTQNFEGVKQVGMLFKREFDEIGFKTEWQDGSSFNRSGHMVANYQGKNTTASSLKILMIGHLDTVFAKDDPFQAYTPLDDRFVAGPGITDMKGGNVIILTALTALKNLDLLDGISIRVVLTGDEERSGRPLALSKKALIDGAKWADIALGFEDGDSNIKTAVVARRGSVGWQLDVTGNPAHSSQVFTKEVGFGAIFEAARILNGFREKLSEYGNLTFNPGVILGGTTSDYDPQSATGSAFGKSNVVAKILTVRGDIRALSPEELAYAKQNMQIITDKNLPGTRATLVIGEGYPPMAPTDGNYQLLNIYSDVSESLGYGPVEAVNPRNAGAADISFAADHVDMALDGLGLMGSGGHTKDEKADMHSFDKNTHKAAILIYRLSKLEQ